MLSGWFLSLKNMSLSSFFLSSLTRQPVFNWMAVMIRKTRPATRYVAVMY